jgi:hypothetical protein
MIQGEPSYRGIANSVGPGLGQGKVGEVAPALRMCFTVTSAAPTVLFVPIVLFSIMSLCVCGITWL